jgi:hypothetical protein
MDSGPAPKRAHPGMTSNRKRPPGLHRTAFPVLRQLHINGRFRTSAPGAYFPAASYSGAVAIGAVATGTRNRHDGFPPPQDERLNRDHAARTRTRLKLSPLLTGAVNEIRSSRAGWAKQRVARTRARWACPPPKSPRIQDRWWARHRTHSRPATLPTLRRLIRNRPLRGRHVGVDRDAAQQVVRRP